MGFIIKKRFDFEIRCVIIVLFGFYEILILE